MNVYFIVEDSFGQYFIKKFFNKKMVEGIILGCSLYDARSSTISSKLTRIVTAALDVSDRVVVVADADGKPISDVEITIRQWLPNSSNVRIVILDHEIEDWICYSLNLRTQTEKPSKVLKHHISYEKNQLPNFADQIDCTRLRTCASFQRFLTALT